MFAFSSQDKTIAEFIKITPFISMWTIGSQYCVWLPGWSTTVCLFCDGCSRVSCLFWAVKLSSVLQKNPPAPADSSVFKHFCIFEPFPAVTVWFWDSSFHTEDNWGTQTQLLKKVQTFTDAPEGNTMH